MVSRKVRSWTVAAILALATFVVTHQLVFLYTYGAGMDVALARTGHGTGWNLTEMAVAMLAVGWLLSAGAELLRLGRRSRRLEDAGLASLDEPVGDLVRGLMRGWLLLALFGAVLFTLSENVEHALIGAQLPGLGVFGGPEYSGTLPVLLAVSFGLAGLRALYGWRRATLIARLRAPRVTLPRAIRPVAFPPGRDDDRRPPTYLGGAFASRAPPRPGVA